LVLGLGFAVAPFGAVLGRVVVDFESVAFAPAGFVAGAALPGVLAGAGLVLAGFVAGGVFAAAAGSVAEVAAPAASTAQSRATVSEDVRLIAPAS
jgi:hypothetical protein